MKICPLCTERAAERHCEASSPEGPRVYWRCGNCDLVFLDPGQRLGQEAERKHYGLHENSREDAGYCHFLSQLTHPLLEKLAGRAPDVLSGLDFGCGPAPVLAELMGDAGFPMEVYDPLFHPDASALESQYDFVTCSEVAEHFFDPGGSFGLLQSLVKPGGWLGVMTGMLPSWEGFADWHYRRDPTHVCFYSLQTMGWIANTAGWGIETPCRNVVLFERPFQ